MRTPKLEFPARLSRSGGESLYPDRRECRIFLNKSPVFGGGFLVVGFEGIVRSFPNGGR